MLKKPSNYEEIQVNEDFTPISLGGHKGIIVGASEYTSDISGNTSLKIVVDTDKDDSQPNYFTEQYKNALSSILKMKICLIFIIFIKAINEYFISCLLYNNSNVYN